jgi:hypothetical protein
MYSIKNNKINSWVSIEMQDIVILYKIMNYLVENVLNYFLNFI